MEQHNHNYAQITNLPTLNIKSQLTLNIDSNTHIKQVLNSEACLIDAQVEPMQHKALVKGVIGVKVVYIDSDNMFNSLSESFNFSETISGENINTESLISISNNQILSTFENDEKTINVSIDGFLEFICNYNINLNVFYPNNSELISKKSTISTYSCVQKLNKSVDYNFDFKLNSKINKILSYDSKVVIEDVKCYDGYLLVNGQIINTIIYEINTDIDGVKCYNNSTPFKCEVEASNCDNECMADISAYINLNNTQISTDINDNDTAFNIEYCIIINGGVYKNNTIDIVEDIYSTTNFIDVINNEYTIYKKTPYVKLTENVDAEITLNDELNVDEIIGMVNTRATTTQHIIKNDNVVVEGVISGNLLYLDDNRQIKHLDTQVPFSIVIKQELQNEICGINLSLIPTSCKCKIKRGNVLMIDYELNINGNIYTQHQVQLIDSVKYGKNLDYGDIAFQIYIAHANESVWDLCKRLHISQQQLIESNPEIPSTYLGGEKIIIYR